MARTALAGRREAVEEGVVFRNGEAGFHTFRIPALLATRTGTLLAFAEGRRDSRGDSGNIDVVLKRSSDHGRTWSALKVVVDRRADTVGNPCPVQDRVTGRILLPLTWNPGNVTESQMVRREVEARRGVLLTHSDDDGRTWAAPSEITSVASKPNWTWYATGPGIGIQTRSGRLLIPCDHQAEGSANSASHVLYSDDHGATWRVGGEAAEGTNECQLVELGDGSLLLNMRGYRGKNRRAIARSRDEGKSWSNVAWDETLIEPVCQASLIGHKGVFYFSNPAAMERRRMTVRVSTDGCRTWSNGRVLSAGPAAYSCLAVLDAKRLGCLYERGEQ
ncbi:MAG: sialidase family protein, partial [Bryobacteraceae bacterium]